MIVAKHSLITAVFSIWVGGWTMAKIYKYFFNSVKDSANLTLERFIPDKFIWLGLLSESTRKETFLIIVWWVIGILAALMTYNLLRIIFISS